MVIRDITQADMAQLAELYAQFWGDTSVVEKMQAEFLTIEKEGRHIILAAEENGKMVASVMGIVCRELYGDCRPFLLVENMIVDNTCRRSGIGGELLSALEARAKALNCIQMILVTETDRVDACAFYEKFGFPAHNKGYKKKL